MEIEISNNEKKSFKERYHFLVNIALFIITFFTTNIAGIEWMYGFDAAMNLNNFALGLPYSLSILFVLACHEFGHYFAAKYHRVKATLPYFIPFPVVPGIINFGTFGAVIKTKTVIHTRKAMFDIGIAGPIAGFIACVGILIYGFLNLPDVSYILRIHPFYFSNIKDTDALELVFGSNILYSFLQSILTNPEVEFVPPMSEMYHYPYLIVGWFGLLVTSMNLIPVGQLDGGHISYALFGSEKHLLISRITFFVLLILGLFGTLDILYPLPFKFGWTGWLVWALVLKFIIKLQHPEIYDFTPLDPKRRILGYFAFFMFIVSFIPTPLYINF